ncbi:acid protease [Trametes versicolor FP-101664 SS1]|uniref:acid protease n=1 Tax=Trametes versicolor (strain FP-101664) TaxID=717944 RepID=UPI0004622642|nr:acid protease [Trametes versicolor FP-101664 SS1]EIW64103.1 acid protease [Trametes versicolor FP-101664 SS1]
MLLRPLLSLLISSASLISALRLPISSRQQNPHPYSVAHAGGDEGFGFTHIYDQQYTVTLTVNGVPFQVLCDTGSPDTWIDPVIQGITPPDMIYTGKNNSATYADGTVSSGQLVLANITLGPYAASNQAIMLSPKGSPSPDWFQGILGLSRVSISTTHELLSNGTPFAENGRPIAHNILSSLEDQPNYFTFLLSRPELGVNPGGVFTISELVTELSAITSAPRLETLGNGTWTTLLDGVYVNGMLLDGHSEASEAYASEFHHDIPGNATIAAIDTGSSYARGPQYYVDTIFKDVAGAIPTDNADGSNGFGYVIPCDTKLNISFVFGGQQYPVHPIDMVTVNTTPNGTFYCTGAISHADESDGSSGPDWLLGDTFLRNVYSLFDLGWDTNPSEGPAYMQLLSITDADAAWAETDKLLLERIVAHNAYFTSTRGVTPTTTQYAWTGSTPVISVSSADDKQTYAPLPSGAAPHLGEWGTSESSATPTSPPVYQQTTSPQGAASQQLVAGALAEDDTGSSNAGSKADSKRVDDLLRDSTVIIGMLAGVIVLLILVVVLMVRANRANKGYRDVPGGAVLPVKAYEDAY